MSFEVTVTPQVTNVEVDATIQPFEVQITANDDLVQYVDDARQYAEDAEDSADSASASASSASSSASTATTQAGIATTQAGVATSQAGVATAQAGIATTKANEANQSALDALASEQASALSEQNASQSASNALASELASAQSAQDALASEQASALSEANALASEQSASASAQTATTQAGIATTQAGIATTQAGNALTSANNALNSANAAAASAASAAQTGTSTLLTGFSVGSNDTIASTDTILQAFNKTQGQINARVAGTGTAGQVAFWNGTSTQTGDNGLFWDNSNKRLGIGLNNPSSSLHLRRDAGNSLRIDSTTSASNVVINGFGNNANINNIFSRGASLTLTNLDVTDLNGTAVSFQNSNSLSIAYVAGVNVSHSARTGNLAFGTGNGSAPIQRMTIFATGNVAINTTTDAGFRLDVNGTARVQGALSVTTGGINLTGAQTISTSTGNLTLASDGGNGNILLTPNGTGGVGIGTTAPLGKLHVTNTSDGNITTGIYLKNATGINGGIAIDFDNSIGNNAEARISSIRVSAGDFSSALAFSVVTGGGVMTERMRILSTGNILINTTADAGYQLDVNGTARVQGAITTDAPTGGTAKPFKIGAVATVTPTSPNRTIEIEIDGTTYYLTAKTTND